MSFWSPKYHVFWEGLLILGLGSVSDNMWYPCSMALWNSHHPCSGTPWDPLRTRTLGPSGLALQTRKPAVATQQPTMRICWTIRQIRWGMPFFNHESWGMNKQHGFFNRVNNDGNHIVNIFTHVKLPWVNDTCSDLNVFVWWVNHGLISIDPSDFSKPRDLAYPKIWCLGL